MAFFMYPGSNQYPIRLFCILRRHIVSSCTWLLVHTCGAGSSVANFEIQAKEAQHHRTRRRPLTSHPILWVAWVHSSVEHSLSLLLCICTHGVMLTISWAGVRLCTHTILQRAWFLVHTYRAGISVDVCAAGLDSVTSSRRQ